MDITFAAYTPRGGIELVADGVKRYIPDDPGNRFRRALALWEQQGNTITPYVAPAPTVEQVSVEAERRIAAGTTINGKTFRTDDATMIRLRGLIDAFDQALVPPQGFTYRTAAGDSITFVNKVMAQSFYDAANQFRSAVLVASALLQAMTPIPADFASNEAYWP